MNATLERSQFELDNSCQCRHCDACSIGTESATCDECEQPTREIDYCDGACYDYKLEWLEESVDSFVEAIGNPYELRIEGRRMGWTSASGYAICKANSKDLLAKLTFNGDWRLRFVFEGNTLAITRWSHDEPTGASFEVVAEIEEEEQE